jgi:hypothetical protein
MSTLIGALARASDDFANFAQLINLVDWRFCS